MSVLDFLARLGVALICGAGIGIERQWRQRLAGLRTNALVAAGSCLFASLGGMFPDEGSPTRVTAQIVSGIGFLGAGVIMRDGLNIRGLNTAATLWCTAAIGACAGCGFLFQAAVGGFVVVTANLLLRPIAIRLNRQSVEATENEFYYALKITCRRRDENHIRALLLHWVGSEQLSLRGIESVNSPVQNYSLVTAAITTVGVGTAALERIVGRLTMEAGVSSASWEVMGAVEEDHAETPVEEEPKTGFGLLRRGKAFFGDSKLNNH